MSAHLQDQAEDIGDDPLAEFGAAVPAVDLLGDPMRAVEKRPNYGTNRFLAQVERDKIFQSGLTPLMVMHSCMVDALKAGDLAVAFDRAAEMAPYVHPRLQQTAVGVGVGGLSDGQGGPLRVQFQWAQSEDEAPGR